MFCSGHLFNNQQLQDKHGFYLTVCGERKPLVAKMQWNMIEASISLSCEGVCSGYAQWFPFLFQQWFKTYKRFK